jgi:hypothetical protein
MLAMIIRITVYQQKEWRKRPQWRDENIVLQNGKKARNCGASASLHVLSKKKPLQRIPLRQYQLHQRL